MQTDSYLAQNHAIINTKNHNSMTEKEIYLTPETEEMTLCLEKTVLDVSATGFSEKETFDDAGWTIL